jgi:MOSC domain-containing protein YiiM
MAVRGCIFSINVSDGGVPKHATSSAWIRINGVEGDRQRNRTLHGGPNRAVCVYSLESIQILQGEGHPIMPGSIGENLTLAGIDWSAMVPGALVEAGAVLLELTSYTAPCRNIRDSFVNGDFSRVSQKLHPGWSRLYARVLEEGIVTPGRAVVIRDS